MGLASPAAVSFNAAIFTFCSSFYEQSYMNAEQKCKATICTKRQGPVHYSKIFNQHFPRSLHEHNINLNKLYSQADNTSTFIYILSSKFPVIYRQISAESFHNPTHLKNWSRMESSWGWGRGNTSAQRRDADPKGRLLLQSNRLENEF